MPTLGDKLRELEAVRAEKEAAARAAADRDAKNRESRRVKVLEDWFEGLKVRVADIISAGSIPGTYTVPPESPHNGTHDILNAQHQDHRIYAAFKLWARSEGLHVSGQNNTNGAQITIRALSSSEASRNI